MQNNTLNSPRIVNMQDDFKQQENLGEIQEETKNFWNTCRSSSLESDKE
jgi:hypothetical protein